MKITKIFGPPGTGKTTTLLRLVEEMLNHYRPQEIAFVSFTRKGAYEGRDRAVEKFAYRDKDFPYFRTLHSIAFHEIGANREMMLNWKDYRFFSQHMGMNFFGYFTEDLNHDDDRFLFYDILKRNNAAQAETLAAKLDKNKCEYVSQNFRKFKQEYRKYDFTDIIEKYIAEGEPLPVRVAIVDEAQDLSTLQWEMVFKAFANVDHLYIAGDDDQAIYQWSGADVDRFQTVPGEKFILDRGYRLPFAVHNIAIQISGQIQKRETKYFKPTNEMGSVTFHNDLSTVPYNRGESWLCLTRNTWFFRQYVSDFMRRKIVYNHRGESSVSQKDLNLIGMYETARRAGKIDHETKIALRKVCGEIFDIKNPWHWVFNWPSDKKLYYLDIIGKGKPAPHDISAETIHAVKGGEAENVVVLLSLTQAVTEACETDRDSELRCLYVACTRARKNLHIVHSKGLDSKYDQIIKGIQV